MRMSSVPAVSQLQMRSLPTDIDAGTLRERVIEVTHQHLLKLRKELEAALRLFELETVKSELTLQVPLRAGAGAIVGRPLRRSSELQRGLAPCWSHSSRPNTAGATPSETIPQQLTTFGGSLRPHAQGRPPTTTAFHYRPLFP